jgi:RNA polymerase sigma-70 factor (ECF subfamily)
MKAPTQDRNEADLLAALRQGEADAYEQLVRQHAGRLLAVTRRILGNEEDARDAVQDAFLSAFKGLANFDAASSLSTWLHRIAVNAALMKLRIRKRKPDQPIEALLPRFLDDGHMADPSAPWAGSAEQLLLQKETRELVRRSIDELPEAYRTVLLLRDIEEMDTEETAEALGVTVSVVKTRLHRARQALRQLLAPHFRGGPA